ncbi:MAG: polysaccharide deacetylase family protein [Parcubacteria group bacterium]|jgi:peptidoglycan/xylan/chitin deacetylase (PgdA/CDA1 family)
MHNKKLKKIKFTITIFVAMAVLAMVGGILIFKNNYYLSQEFLLMQGNFVKAKWEYASYAGGYKNLFTGKLKEKNTEDKQEDAQSVPVLLYHGIIEDPNWKPDGVNISLEEFKKQMFTLKKAGYQTITLEDFYSFMQEEKKLPKKSLLITFDDGRSDSFYPSDPIFHALDYNAVMFVITGRSLGKGNEKSVFHLSKTELQGMKATGRWEFGSHTQNGHNTEKIDENGNQGHFMSDKLWLDAQNRLETDEEYTLRIKKDLAASKEDLKNNLGISALAFAYPFGDYGHNTQNNPTSEEIIKNNVSDIFPLSFRQSGASEFPANYAGKDFKLVKRINMDSDISASKLLFILEGNEKKTFPYADSFSEDRGWITGWGKSSLENGLLLTGASESEDSSLTFLGGTFLWRDYSISANAKFIKGNSFSVIGRYISGNNYVSCDFSNFGVSLTERVKGEERIISESAKPLALISGTDLSVGMSTKGDQASCLIEGKALVSGKLSSDLSHGGIGFKTWDNSINNSSILISNLDVK